MDHPECATADLGSLRTGLLAAGMASSEPVARKAQHLLCPTLTGWGMTEVGVGALLSFLDSPEDDRCLGSGWPLPGYEFKVIDPATAQSLPPGTMGELCTRGYGVMQGYYKKPEETAKAIDAEGWLHTGDMALMREDGMVRFLGRYKEMLKVGGENVDPVEVEAFLLQHPAVNQVKIVGVPDARLSEVGAACLVLNPGTNVTATDLHRILPWQTRQLQDPTPCRIGEGIPHDLQRQGAEVSPARGGHGGAEARGHLIPSASTSLREPPLRALHTALR